MMYRVNFRFRFLMKAFFILSVDFSNNYKNKKLQLTKIR